MEIVSNFIEGFRALSPSMQGICIFLLLVLLIFFMRPKSVNNQSKREFKWSLFLRKEKGKERRSTFKLFSTFLIATAIITSSFMLSNAGRYIADVFSEAKMYEADTVSAYGLAGAKLELDAESARQASAEANKQTAEANAEAEQYRKEIAQAEADKEKATADKAASDAITAQAEADKEKAAADKAASDATVAQAEADKEKASADKAASDAITAQAEADKAKEDAKSQKKSEVEAYYWGVLYSSYQKTLHPLKKAFTSGIFGLMQYGSDSFNYQTELKKCKKECPNVYSTWISHPEYRDISDYSSITTK